MAKSYLVRFGSGDPTSFSGLSPTFIQWRLLDTGGSTTPPGITEIASGCGLYRFEYNPLPDTPIAFVLDGGSTITDTGSRYLVGSLDTIQQVDEVVGFSTDSVGSTNIDPSTIFGMAKRLQEDLEGNASFNKTSGLWEIQTRGGTLLIAKTLTNSSGQVTKT